MMLFSKSQIEELLKIVDLHSVYLVGYNLGSGILTSADKQLLKQFNIEIDTFNIEYPSYLKAYLWGRLAALLGEARATSITFTDYKRYLELKQWEPLSQQEKNEYEVAQLKTYEHIKSFGERIKAGVNDTIISEDQASRLDQQRVLSGEILASVVNRRSLQSIITNIGQKLKDWRTDWGRIVDTELQDIYNRGKMMTYLEKYGSEQRVYKDTYAGACRFCIRLHTTGGIGSEPKIFTIDELMANGTNIGKKKEDWLATIGPEHPFCRCDLRVVLDGQEWDKKKKRYITSTPIPKVERKSKIKIKVGTQNFEV